MTKPPSAPSVWRRLGRRRDREQSHGQEQGEGVWPGACSRGTQATHPHTWPLGRGVTGQDVAAGANVISFAASCLLQFSLKSGTEEWGQPDPGGVPGDVYLHFFCRMLCLALMNARMSESVCLSPVRGMDDMGLSKIEDKRTSQCYKSLHPTLHLIPGCSE